VIVGGESSDKSRVCNYDWVMEIRNACIQNNVSFIFKQTGSLFMKEGKNYKIPRKHQSWQARKAGIDIEPSAHPQLSD